MGVVKIVVVDPDKKVLKELEKELQYGDYQLTTNDTFQKGFRALQDKSFDVVVLKYNPVHFSDADITTLVFAAKQKAPTNLIILLSDQELPQLTQHTLALIDASLSNCNLLSTNDFSTYLKKLIRKSNVTTHKRIRSKDNKYNYQGQQAHSGLIGYDLGKYYVLEHLGGSDLTTVYKALDSELKQVVALKCLNENIEDELIRKRFIREGKLVAELKHQNINPVYSIEETIEGRLFIVMSYVQGHNLEKRLNDGNLPFVKTLDYALQIAQGLVYAHEKGIIHRDVKPSNIMVTSEGNIRILDFGVAKKNLDRNSQSLTKQGSLLGTVAYMSPEQLLGKKVSEHTDCWAFGLLLYIMITGEHPFMLSNVNYNVLSLIESILEKTLQPASTLYPSIPNKLDKLIMQLLCKEPYQERPRMHEVVERLQDIKDAY